jgi:predicted small lipoprotein YifL
MKFKIIVLIILFFSVTFNGCGRKAEPLKPSEIIQKK